MIWTGGDVETAAAFWALKAEAPGPSCPCPASARRRVDAPAISVDNPGHQAAFRLVLGKRRLGSLCHGGSLPVG